MFQVDIINKSVNYIYLVKYLELKALESKPYFTSQDVAEILGIKHASAIVLSTRYVKKGLFIRLKKDLYVIKDRWQRNSHSEYFQIANILQVPSYISLLTALSFYEVTTQVQRGFFESVCVKRTARYEIDGILFNYYKLNKELYFDFIKQGDFFIATKEKALLDAVYLWSFGKYSFDLSSIDISKIDLKRLKKLLTKYPDRTKRAVEKICKI
jgi:predicted transcriptional regulator of viral defense system